MKNSSIMRMIILLVSILFFGITIAVGLIFELATANFWTNIAIMALIAIIGFFSTFANGEKNKTFYPFFLKYTRKAIGYVVIATIISLSCMFIKSLHFLIPLCLHLVVFVVFMIYILSKSAGVKHIMEVDEKQRKDVLYLRNLELKLSYAHDLSENNENKELMAKLIRAVQNSTYNSFPEAKDVELELLNLADELAEASVEEQQKLIKKLNVLLNKRNNIIAMVRR